MGGNNCGKGAFKTDNKANENKKEINKKKKK
jgi:hypothetical protein